MIKSKLNKKNTNRPPDDFLWSSQKFTLNEILVRFKLPCVVHCCYHSCPIILSDFRWDLSQPLLLYSHHRVRKVVGTCLHSETTENNETKIAIPEKYEGWFYFIKSEDDRPTIHRGVDTLAQSQAERFYVASSLSCLTINKFVDKECVQDSIVNSGEVLKRYNGPDAVKKIETVNKDCVDQYLVFKDEHNDDIILQKGKRGKFLEVFSDADDDSNVIRPISDVIKRKEAFPLTIRHVVGDLPAVPHGYSKIIRCCDVIEEEVLLAYAVSSQMFIEIRIDTEFEFRIALNENELKESNDNYISAVKMCELEGLKYLSDMKLACVVSPLTSSSEKAKKHSYENIPSILKSVGNDAKCIEDIALDVEPLDDTPSCYDSGSEIEEEDAQSEFSFEWTPTDLGENSSKPRKKPKVFNSSLLCLNSPSASKEKDMNLWNTQPDVV